MSGFLPIYLYFFIILLVTLTILIISSILPIRKDVPAKFMPYESGIQTTTDLFNKRFPLRHYLVGLIFLIFDIEVVFLYPWAVVAKTIGPFAFYEVLFFLVAMFIGFIYIWRKGGLQWE